MKPKSFLLYYSVLFNKQHTKGDKNIIDTLAPHLNRAYYIIPDNAHISHSLDPVARIYFEPLFICFIRTRCTFPFFVHNSVGLIRLTCSLPFTSISCRNISITFINNCIDVITAIWKRNVLYVLIRGAIFLTVYTGRFKCWLDSWCLFPFCLP